MEQQFFDTSLLGLQLAFHSDSVRWWIACVLLCLPGWIKLNTLTWGDSLVCDCQIMCQMSLCTYVTEEGAPRGWCWGKSAKSSDITNVNIMRKQWEQRWNRCSPLEKIRHFFLSLIKKSIKINIQRKYVCIYLRTNLTS